MYAYDVREIRMTALHCDDGEEEFWQSHTSDARACGPKEEPNKPTPHHALAYTYIIMNVNKIIFIGRIHRYGICVRACACVLNVNTLSTMCGHDNYRKAASCQSSTRPSCLVLNDCTVHIIIRVIK